MDRGGAVDCGPRSCRGAAAERRAAIQAQGRTYYLQQRMESAQGANRGSIEGMAGALDQIRQASAASYPAQRQAFALRNAQAPNWAQFGPRGGPGAGGPGGGG